MNIQVLAERGSTIAVGVIGDLCVDAYDFLSDEPGEISVETGKPTNSVEKYYFDLGAAANVALNLKRLGTGRVELFGLIGNDPFGEVILRQLREEGIVSRIVVQREGWATHVYSKIYKSGMEEPRLDIGNFNSPSEEAVDALIASLAESLPGLDAVIINEQVLRGLHSPYFQEKLLALINTYQEKHWFCDSRNLNDVYKAAVHKLNDREAAAIYQSHNGAGDEKPLREITAWLYEHWKRPVVVTRGAAGAAACDGNGFWEVPGLHIINPTDTVGAGDAFLSALVFGLSAGLPLGEALELGNFSAGVSVQKLYQTGHPVFQEILAISESPDYRCNPDLAANPQGAEYLKGTARWNSGKPGKKAGSKG
jgi:sugar/nucleoside kinase (ribokinase family)